MVYSIFIPDGAKSMLHRILICFNCVFALVFHYPMEVGCHDMTRYLMRNSYGSDQSKLGQHIHVELLGLELLETAGMATRVTCERVFLFKLDPKKNKTVSYPQLSATRILPKPMVNRAGKLLSSSIRPSFMAHFSPFRGISALERRSR